MTSPTRTGDLALAARPPTEETFAPFGRLLLPGERRYLGRKRRMLLAVDEQRPGPRRVTDLYRYPEARRVLLPLAAVGMWFVALDPGEGSDGPAGAVTALLLAPGCGVLVNEGVWHAGPTALDDATVCEMLEAAGETDRFDRRSLRELVDVTAVRVRLPEDAAERGTPFTLAAPGAIRMDPALEGRVRLACVHLSDLQPADDTPELASEIETAVSGLRAMWGHAGDVSEIPGVSSGRDVLRRAGVDPTQCPAPVEAVLARILAGGRPAYPNTLSGALALCALRMLVPLAVLDAGAVAGPVIVRAGRAGEAYPGEDGGRLGVEGAAVLSDPMGILGGPLGAAQRARPASGTREALVTAYCPIPGEPQAVQRWLDGIVKTVTRHCGGREADRLVVG